jgi:hypothetical protein
MSNTSNKVKFGLKTATMPLLRLPLPVLLPLARL